MPEPILCYVRCPTCLGVSALTADGDDCLASGYGRRAPNQVVAYNLRRARILRGWTQSEAVVKLEKHVGALWSVQNYSAAERSAEREDRIRNFTADEIMAFAEAFELPLMWFFAPPEKGEAHA